MAEAIEKFLDELDASLKNRTFVKMTLGNYKGADKHLQRINARLVDTKKGSRLYVLYKYDTRDTAKNYGFDEVRPTIAPMFDGEFYSGHLFTTTNDFQLDIGKKGKARLNVAKPTIKTRPTASHDREKARRIDSNAFYLNALGITADDGRVRDKQQDKWRQINKFVEVLESLVDNSTLKDRQKLKVVDMGSGKGYLTFAAYDYFNNIRKVHASVSGVETRPDLVSLCNDVADASGFPRLEFVQGTIDSFNVSAADILIALHACNTATDDAIYKGIRAGAQLIIVVPCCHHELRSQIKPPAMLKDVLKHAVMLERVAETMTDGLRSLLMERNGYSTKLFEFVAVEHTPKNNMLVGTRNARSIDREGIDRQISEIKEFYGIEHHHLESLLDKTDPREND